jgi:hypothetical protein
MRHHLAEGLHVRPVLTDRMRALSQIRGTGSLKQHRVGEPVDFVRGQPGSCRDLFDGLSRTDAGLDLTWAHLALQLDFDLAESGGIATGGRTQSLVRRQLETLATDRVLADDGRTVLAESHHPERAHRKPPDDFTSLTL